MKFEMFPVGTIFSPYKTKASCPIQGVYALEGIGRVEVFPEYEEALDSIEFFSHIYLLYIFDRAGEIILKRPTFLDDAPHGIFACRHPCRPNGIGISIVKLIERDKNILHVSGIDVLDGTPLVDIKPYAPKFDFRPDAVDGWTVNKEFLGKTPDRE